jgi:hypothetical protein
MIKKALSAVLIILLSLNSGFPDRASIPFISHIKVYEPNQKAFIAWNGNEEILLLTTDLKASESTRVLEVIPFPTEPLVSKGDFSSFEKATKIIEDKLKNLKIAYTLWDDMDSSGSDGIMQQTATAGKLTFHEKIGNHDISVVEVIDDEYFIKWVENYLKRNGVPNPIISDEAKDVIDEYLYHDFHWFVFDVVEIGESLVSNEPIQYRFKTDYLYYPLRISRTDTGHTDIDLLILSNEALWQYLGIPRYRIKLMHRAVLLTKEELKDISPDMYDLMGDEKSYTLKTWRISGNLKSFNWDLMVK